MRSPRTSRVTCVSSGSFSRTVYSFTRVSRERYSLFTDFYIIIIFEVNKFKVLIFGKSKNLRQFFLRIIWWSEVISTNLTILVVRKEKKFGRLPG
jgi:hypothetical protein